jgi:LysM repeat protein
MMMALGTLTSGAFTTTVEASPAQNGYTEHVVQLGDTLYSIARIYGVSPEAIAHANGLINANYIFAGQRLTIPGSHAPSYDRPGGGQPGAVGGSHRVGLGETLYGIAASYGSTVSAILAANGLANPDYIYAGQVLVIPGAGSGAPGGYKPGPAGHCGETYWVKPGDTLSAIAWRFGSGANAIARANGLRFPFIIYAGQGLHIPCDQGVPAYVGHKPPPGRKPAPSKPPVKRAPALQPAACARQVQIVSPKMNEKIKGTIQIIGTATVDNFQFYKVEYARGTGPLDEAFASIGEVHRYQVSDSILATWYTGNMPEGAYTLRLTAVYNTGNIARPCDVTVHIAR